MTHHKSLLVPWLLVTGLACNALRGQDPVAAVRGELAYGYCRTLAGERFEGRLTGSPGYTAAARWAAGQFEKWGLKPLFGGKSFLQDYPSPYSVIEQAELTLKTPGKEGAEGKQLSLDPVKDFLPLLFSDSGEAEAELVFAGWGIHAPELGYDDYAGVDARGKFVICFRGVPDPSRDGFTEHDQHRTRMKQAAERGARGLFYIYNEVQANPNGDRIAGFLPLEISTSAADLILSEKGFTSADLRRDLLRYQRPLSFALKTRALLKVKARYFPEGIGHNIGAFIEGTDPQLRQEWIVLGAHFDHCGKHSGALFPGADDNASGSATVLEAARVLALPGHSPRRSILFALFGGEEMGLLGSQWFVKNEPYQGKKFAGMINVDMTGEGDSLGCGYGGEPVELKKILDTAGARLQIALQMREIRAVGVRSSDFAPFFLKGIPVVSLASNGPHLFYHQAGDTIYRINPEMLADSARFGVAVALELANR